LSEIATKEENEKYGKGKERETQKDEDVEKPVKLEDDKEKSEQENKLEKEEKSEEKDKDSDKEFEVGKILKSSSEEKPRSTHKKKKENSDRLHHSNSPDKTRIVVSQKRDSLGKDGQSSPKKTKSSSKSIAIPKPSWSITRVVEWVASLGLDSNYAKKLKRHQVDGEDLLDMTSEEAWEKVGITNKKDIKKLLAALPN